MCRKKQVLNANGRILDAVEVRAPFLVARGDAQVRASDDHERRSCNEADEIVSQPRLCQLVPDRFIKDKIELPALKISGARRPAKGLDENIDRALGDFLVLELPHASSVFNDVENVHSSRVSSGRKSTSDTTQSCSGTMIRDEHLVHSSPNALPLLL